MTSPHPPSRSSVPIGPGAEPAPDGAWAQPMSTTRLLRAVTTRLLSDPQRSPRPRWRDRRASWLTLPAGWSRVSVSELVVAVPGPAPGGTTLLLVVEPVRVVVSGSIDGDYERAVSDAGSWSPSGAPIRREALDGWSALVGTGVLRVGGTAYPALTAVARRNTLRARFWVLADSEDTRERYTPAVLAAISSVERFAAEAACERAG